MEGCLELVLCPPPGKEPGVMLAQGLCWWVLGTCKVWGL